MYGDIGEQILITFALIILNGIFSMTELAIVSARKARLESLAEEGDKGAEAAIKLGENPNQMFSTIQIGITLIAIVTGLYGGATFSEPMAYFLKTYFPSIEKFADAISPFLIVTIVTYLSLVVGELVPKRIAQNNPEQISIIMARPMKIFSIICRPLVSFLSISTAVLLKIMGVKNKEDIPVTEDEIKIMLSQGAAMGAFEKEEPELVDNIFRLADLNAGDVMTPRTQLKWIDLETEEDDIRQVITNAQHYRLPVGRDSLDELVGIVQISDIFTRQLQTHGTIALKDLIQSCTKTPLMVPESVTLVKLLELFRSEGVHETIVLDEYGGFSGLVTLHDIMEEIVGWMPISEVQRKEEENRIIKRDDQSWFVDGLLNVEDFREYLSMTNELPGEDEDLYKTVGGFVTYMLGRIPKEGEKVSFDGYTFEVADMDNTRVDKLLVTHTSIDV